MNEIVGRERNMDKKMEELAFVLLDEGNLRSVQKETRENSLELKSKNILINGITEKQDENPLTTATKFLPKLPLFHLCPS